MFYLAAALPALLVLVLVLAGNCVLFIVALQFFSCRCERTSLGALLMAVPFYFKINKVAEPSGGKWQNKLSSRFDFSLLLRATFSKLLKLQMHF